MQPNQSNKNPYASAAGAYGNNAQKHAGDPRELEARVLLKSAGFLTDLQADWGNHTSDDIASILKYNRSIWLMFVSGMRPGMIGMVTPAARARSTRAT